MQASNVTWKQQDTHISKHGSRSMFNLQENIGQVDILKSILRVVWEVVRFLEGSLLEVLKLTHEILGPVKSG